MNELKLGGEARHIQTDERLRVLLIDDECVICERIEPQSRGTDLVATIEERLEPVSMAV